MCGSILYLEINFACFCVLVLSTMLSLTPPEQFSLLDQKQKYNISEATSLSLSQTNSDSSLKCSVSIISGWSCRKREQSGLDNKWWGTGSPQTEEEKKGLLSSRRKEKGGSWIEWRNPAPVNSLLFMVLDTWSSKPDKWRSCYNGI